jgi:hypothetical protein
MWIAEKNEITKTTALCNNSSLPFLWTIFVRIMEYYHVE